MGSADQKSPCSIRSHAPAYVVQLVNRLPGIFITNTEVQGEIWPQLEIILEEVVLVILGVW